MKRLKNWRMQTKIIFLAAVIILTVLLATAPAVLYLVAGSTERQMGARALDIARTLSVNPPLQEAFYSTAPIERIAPLADQVRRLTGADFVIVMDRGGRQFSHPLPGYLGKATAGLDYGPTLMEGRQFYTRLQVEHTPALAGLAPVYGRDGELVGLVSVGFYLQELSALTWRLGGQIAATAAVGLLIGVGGSLLLAGHIKRQMYGLEPPQIAGLLDERTTVLQSVREGIIAVDAEERITVANQEARRIIGFEGDPVGRPVRDLVPQSRLHEVLESGQAQYDQEMILGGRVVVANRVPLRHEGRVVGVVASFRDRTELNRLASELTAARRYSDALRAQAHEFNNRLHAVAGLVQLGATDEAVEYILRTQGQHQSLLDLLARTVPDPLVGAIILGKYNRAAELHVRLEMDPASRFAQAPEDLGPDLLVTVLGNLMDNAIEAVQALPEEQRWVRVLLDDQGPAVRITVTDGGPGVPPALQQQIFTDGFSTKAPTGRGFGLALVSLLVTQAGGRIWTEEAPSRFVITFPGRALA
ncbi:MAG TPA: sensor histidine kinase [Symbiobacteriaceae bacterium]|jgi:two-component system CitB family sensor kinase